MSPGAPKPYYPESNDPPKPLKIEQHQIDVFRSTRRGNELYEYLEEIEKSQTQIVKDTLYDI